MNMLFSEQPLGKANANDSPDSDIIVPSGVGMVNVVSNDNVKTIDIKH